jgi:hypothetical protein
MRDAKAQGRMAHARPIVRHEFEQLSDAPAEGKREDPWTGGFQETKGEQYGSVDFDVSSSRYRPFSELRKSGLLQRPSELPRVIQIDYVNSA